jgi:hypothetical protein
MKRRRDEEKARGERLRRKRAKRPPGSGLLTAAYWKKTGPSTKRIFCGAGSSAEW